MRSVETEDKLLAAAVNVDEDDRVGEDDLSTSLETVDDVAPNEDVSIGLAADNPAGMLDAATVGDSGRRVYVSGTSLAKFEVTERTPAP